MRIINYILMTAACAIPMLGFADSEQNTKDRMKADLDVIRNIFDVGYAPKEWKNTYSGWNLDTEIQLAKDSIQNCNKISVKQYQEIVRNFFHSAKDYHVSVSFYSTESASLPFTVTPAEGRYFISHIDSKRLNSMIYPINVGDELVLFNNKPAADAANEMMASNTKHANESTDCIIASYFLTHRLGRLGHSVPKGSIVIGVKSPFSQEVRKMQLMWTYQPEKISNGFLGSLTEEKNNPMSIFTPKKFHEKMMVMPEYESIKTFMASEDEDSGDDDKEKFIGSKRSYVPMLGMRIWWVSPPDSSFHAYIYENEDHKLIGYVRIPDYVGWSFMVEEFADLISMFQSRTDALIIDQINNPGGSLFYMYGLLSTLTYQPLYVPKHRMMINQETVFGAISDLAILDKIKSDTDAQDMLGPNLAGMPVTYQMVQFFIDYLNFIVSEWNAGRKLTDPYHILAVDRILPHPWSNYTKPILLLTNSLDISCGDFFPAILQDNKRVTILGSRTAGAGGYVLGSQFPNRFGIEGFSYTGSIAHRLNNEPIENLGVTPDIEYNITADDIQNGYRFYGAAIESAVNSLVNQTVENEKNLD